MGYQVYEIKGEDGNRFGGYGVPSICDHPECDKEIDRGLSYCCGGNPRSDEFGCQQYFCEDHLTSIYMGDNGERAEHLDLCERCVNEQEPFPMKPDTREWMEHMLTDESWEDWRIANPEKTEEMRSQLST